MTVIDIGGRLEPFWDHHLIDRLDDAHLQLHTPQPREIVLRFDRPWEGRAVGYPTILRDGHRYRLYYRGWPAGGDTSSYCLAESDNGVDFERPAIDEHRIAGIRQNNIVFTGAGSHNLAPFIDTHPAALASRRYKALARMDGGDDGRHGLGAFASPDGIQWSLIQDEPVITRGAFDSQNVAFWSEHEGCYVCYYRIFSESGFTAGKPFKGIRTIARATSDDFLNWSEPVAMDFGDTPMEELYTNTTAPYFRAPHVYIALPKRFVPDRAALAPDEAERFGVATGQRNAVSETVFMTSRGGQRYDRTFMEALIRPGLDRRNWVGRNRMCAWGVVPTGERDEEMSLYCQEHYTQPTHRLRRFTLRTDGFASVRAGYAGGEMITKPMTFSGERLTMNYATSAAGAVRVEIQDHQGKPVPGFSLEEATTHFGDRIEQTVAWRTADGAERTDLSALAGKPVRLRFALNDADVYAIRFR